MGSELHQALKALSYGIEEHWEDARHALTLHEGVDPYDFWYSLWRTLLGSLQTRESSKVRSLALRVAQKGLGAFASTHAVLPNGLPGAHRALLRIADVRLVLRGALSIPQVLEALTEWEHFADALNPRETVRSEIHDWATLAHPAYGNSRAQWKSTKLADWVSRLMDDSQRVRVAHGPARVWGGIFDSLNKDELTKEQRDDLDSATTVFSDALFQSSSGSFAPAAQLLDAECGRRRAHALGLCARPTPTRRRLRRRR